MSNQSPISYAAPGPAAKLSKPALISFICGLLLCIPLITGLLACLLGIVGFIGAGKPGQRGRWMAVVGLLLGVLNLGAWSLIGGSTLMAWHWTSGIVSTLRAPSLATHDFIRALGEGNDAAARTHSALSDADFAAAKAMIQAQGDFIDTTLNTMAVDEGGSGHVSGTAQFKLRSLHVKADLTAGHDGWRITSIELLP